jgi:hypothetical protein
MIITSFNAQGEANAFIQAGWYKDASIGQTIEFAEYKCPGLCRRTWNTGQPNTTLTYAVEYDGSVLPQEGGRWCANAGPSLCFITFTGNEVGFSSGAIVQYFTETHASLDQMGGTPTTKVYLYKLSYERVADSFWTVIPQNRPPTWTRWDQVGTPYRGNLYWDTVSNPDSWAIVSYTNTLTPR